MSPNRLTASRIKQLRENAAMNQTEFSKEFSSYLGRESPLAIMTISSWETGRKLPPADTILKLAIFYGCSTDYIYGISDEYTGHYNGYRSKRNPNVEIPFCELSLHDGEPVYVKFKDLQHLDQWGIIDASSNRIQFASFGIDFDSYAMYFLGITDDDITILSGIKHLLNLHDVLRIDRVYIETKSSDPIVKGHINGWYHHDVSHSFLINNNGQTLSYDGLGIYYNAIDYKLSNKLMD